MASMEPVKKDLLLRTEGLCKSYSGVRVLDGIGVRLLKGSVMGLIGGNGAGKSTFIKCVNGVVRPDSGSIFFDGKEFRSMTVARALALGIVTIPQEFNLADEMSVHDNIFLGRELRKHGFLLDHAAMRESSAKLLEDLECSVSPDAEVSTLSVAQKQIVEIARALNRSCRLFILDEPSTVLNPAETEKLFRIIRAMRERGLSILYVSHKLDEIKAVCDEFTVFRDGKFVCTRPVEGASTREMANLMVGGELARIFPPGSAPPENAETLLELDNVSLPKLVHNVSLRLRKGEILGLAGLGGSGRTELAEGIFGIRRFVSGRVAVKGKTLCVKSPPEAVRAGIAYLPEDRQGSGAIQSFPLKQNCSLISLASKYCRAGFIRGKAEARAAEEYIRAFAIKTPSVGTLMSELSGGNQQKGVIAKSLDSAPDIFIFDEPTRGIDIKSRSDIYYFIDGLARRGTACLVISSDLGEIIGLCGKTAVMRGGTIAGFLEGEHVNEKEIMYLATGVK